MIEIPAELLDYRQWVLWRKAEVHGRITKIPISPWSGKAAACDKPQTWSTYRHVRYALRRHQCDGLGFVFTPSDPYCGIDLDHCRTTSGSISSEARELIRRFNSYAELSPSGMGLHILVKATLQGAGRRAGKIELYDRGRYFTVTGKHISGTPPRIEDRQEIIDYLQTEMFASRSQTPSARFSGDIEKSDEDLIECAKRARNGSRFRRLWAGDTSDYGNDHSRADLALCRILLFWCRGDKERVDHLFRCSGLMREKWDRQTGSVSYGNRTIQAAIRNI